MTVITKVRPGILVSLKTHVRGGKRYRKRDIEYAHITVDGYEVSRHETTKIVFDPEEQKAAEQVANRAAYLIRKLCVESEHGLLCPVERRDELDNAIPQARALVDRFNAIAVHTRVEVNVVCGEIVADDVNTARALFSETEKFLEQMTEGLEALDVKKVRAIMRKARDVGQMLAPEANAAVAVAVSAASSACKRIVKAGEQAAVEIDQAAIDTITFARNTFLDFDSPEVEVDFAPATGRAIDFEAEAS